MKKSIFNINIYRPERKKKKEWKLPYEEIYNSVLIIISFLLLFCVCIYLIFGLYLPQNRELKTFISQALALDIKLQETKAEALHLKDKGELYLQLNVEALSWPEKLAELTRNLSEKIWFSSIDFPGRSGNIKGGQDLIIIGETFSCFTEVNLDQIGDLIIGLNRAEIFKDAFEPLYLEYTKKSEKDWGTIQFRIIAKTRDLSL